MYNLKTFSYFLLTAFILSLPISLISQNYFTGELFESYQWDVSKLNDLDFELESDIIMQRRLLSKKEDKKGKLVKIEGKFYDEVVIKKNSKVTVKKIKNDMLYIIFDKNEDNHLVFGPNPDDNENYGVYVQELKGEKGVIEFHNQTYRILNGSHIIMGKIKKKKLPPPRTSSGSKSQWLGNGSGLIIDEKGYVVTNFHVVEDADEIVVQINDNDYSAKKVFEDSSNDLALLKITDSKFKSMGELQYTVSSSLSEIGMDVFTLGYPMALSSMGQKIKFTEGSISSITGYQDDPRTYQTSVPVQPGNSGGPLFDTDGNLIGIMNAKIIHESVDNVSYAIKISYLKNLVESSGENIDFPQKDVSGKDIKDLIKIVDNYVVLIKVQ